MNPLSVIAAMALLVTGLGVMSTQNPETDTWGMVSASTAYSPVEAATPAQTSAQETATALYEGAGCAEWADLALRSGFSPADLPTALQVMELESMCLPGEIGDNGQSFGLMQINDYWCTPQKYWPAGYLQTQHLIDDCEQLLDPATNLKVAWHIASNYGWNNWSTYARVAE